jgi:hypothetical protein
MSKRQPVVVSSSPLLKPYELGVALRRRVKQDFAGNFSAAARAAGISQPTFHRYSHPVLGVAPGDAKPIRMKPVVAMKLAAFLPNDMRADLLRSRTATYALYLYTHWLGAASDRSGPNGLSHERRTQHQSPEGVWIDRVTEFAVLLTRIANEVPTVRQDIARTSWRVRLIDPATKQALALLGISWDTPPESTRKQITSARLLLSLYRMVEPLLDSAESGWIELRGPELSKTRFRQFIVASWKREAVTLDRTGDVERMERLELASAENDPRLRPLRLPR